MTVSIKWRPILCVDSSSHGHCNFKSAQIFSPLYRYGALTDIILHLRRQCPARFCTDLSTTLSIVPGSV